MGGVTRASGDFLGAPVDGDVGVQPDATATADGIQSHAQHEVLPGQLNAFEKTSAKKTSASGDAINFIATAKIGSRTSTNPKITSFEDRLSAFLQGSMPGAYDLAADIEALKADLTTLSTQPAAFEQLIAGKAVLLQFELAANPFTNETTIRGKIDSLIQSIDKGKSGLSEAVKIRLNYISEKLNQYEKTLPLRFTEQLKDVESTLRLVNISIPDLPEDSGERLAYMLGQAEASLGLPTPEGDTNIRTLGLRLNRVAHARQAGLGKAVALLAQFGDSDQVLVESKLLSQTPQSFVAALQKRQPALAQQLGFVRSDSTTLSPQQRQLAIMWMVRKDPKNVSALFRRIYWHLGVDPKTREPGKDLEALTRLAFQGYVPPTKSAVQALSRYMQTYAYTKLTDVLSDSRADKRLRETARTIHRNPALRTRVGDDSTVSDLDKFVEAESWVAPTDIRVLYSKWSRNSRFVWAGELNRLAIYVGNQDKPQTLVGIAASGPPEVARIAKKLLRNSNFSRVLQEPLPAFIEPVRAKRSPGLDPRTIAQLSSLVSQMRSSEPTQYEHKGRLTIADFGSLPRVFSAVREMYAAMKGVGTNKYGLLKQLKGLKPKERRLARVLFGVYTETKGYDGEDIGPNALSRWIEADLSGESLGEALAYLRQVFSADEEEERIKQSIVRLLDRNNTQNTSGNEHSSGNAMRQPRGRLIYYDALIRAYANDPLVGRTLGYRANPKRFAAGQTQFAKAQRALVQALQSGTLTEISSARLRLDGAVAQLNMTPEGMWNTLTDPGSRENWKNVNLWAKSRYSALKKAIEHGDEAAIAQAERKVTQVLGALVAQAKLLQTSESVEIQDHLETVDAVEEGVIMGATVIAATVATVATIQAGGSGGWALWAQVAGAGRWAAMAKVGGALVAGTAAGSTTGSTARLIQVASHGDLGTSAGTQQLIEGVKSSVQLSAGVAVGTVIPAFGFARLSQAPLMVKLAKAANAGTITAKSVHWGTRGLGLGTLSSTGGLASRGAEKGVGAMMGLPDAVIPQREISLKNFGVEFLFGTIFGALNPRRIFVNIPLGVSEAITSNVVNGMDPGENLAQLIMISMASHGAVSVVARRNALSELRRNPESLRLQFEEFGVPPALSRTVRGSTLADIALVLSTKNKSLLPRLWAELPAPLRADGRVKKWFKSVGLRKAQQKRSRVQSLEDWGIPPSMLKSMKPAQIHGALMLLQVGAFRGFDGQAFGFAARRIKQVSGLSWKQVNDLTKTLSVVDMRRTMEASGIPQKTVVALTDSDILSIGRWRRAGAVDLPVPNREALLAPLQKQTPEQFAALRRGLSNWEQLAPVTIAERPTIFQTREDLVAWGAPVSALEGLSPSTLWLLHRARSTQWFEGSPSLSVLKQSAKHGEDFGRVQRALSSKTPMLKTSPKGLEDIGSVLSKIEGLDLRSVIAHYNTDDFVAALVRGDIPKGMAASAAAFSRAVAANHVPSAQVAVLAKRLLGYAKAVRNNEQKGHVGNQRFSEDLERARMLVSSALPQAGNPETLRAILNSSRKNDELRGILSDGALMEQTIGLQRERVLELLMPSGKANVIPADVLPGVVGLYARGELLGRVPKMADIAAGIANRQRYNTDALHAIAPKIVIGATGYRGVRLLLADELTISTLAVGLLRNPKNHRALDWIGRLQGTGSFKADEIVALLSSQGKALQMGKVWAEVDRYLLSSKTAETLEARIKGLLGPVESRLPADIALTRHASPGLDVLQQRYLDGGTSKWGVRTSFAEVLNTGSRIRSLAPSELYTPPAKVVAAIANVIEKARLLGPGDKKPRVLVIAHNMTDVDTAASTLALVHYLKANNIEAIPVVGDKPTGRVRAIDKQKLFRGFDDIDEKARFDLTILPDLNEMQLIDRQWHTRDTGPTKVQKLLAQSDVVVNADHHPIAGTNYDALTQKSNRKNGLPNHTQRWINDEASAAGFLVASTLQELAKVGKPVPRAAVEQTLHAIFADTNYLTFAGSRNEMRVVKWLLETYYPKQNPSDVVNRIRREARYRLAGPVKSYLETKAQTNKGNTNLNIFELRADVIKEALRRARIKDPLANSEDIRNYAAEILDRGHQAGKARATLMVYEVEAPDGSIKTTVMLRSKNGEDAIRIAEKTTSIEGWAGGAKQGAGQLRYTPILKAGYPIPASRAITKLITEVIPGVLGNK